jgi:hypothetical protein
LPRCRLPVGWMPDMVRAMPLLYRGERSNTKAQQRRH